MRQHRRHIRTYSKHNTAFHCTLSQVGVRLYMNMMTDLPPPPAFALFFPITCVCSCLSGGTLPGTGYLGTNLVPAVVQATYVREREREAQGAREDSRGLFVSPFPWCCLLMAEATPVPWPVCCVREAGR